MITAGNWESVTPTDFEELTFWLLQREGFFNISWYGKSGGDKGRDLVCERTHLFGPRVLSFKCVVQCKRYKGRVGRARIFDDILKAAEHKPAYFILVTSGIMGASSKDWLASQENTLGMRVVVWERTDLQILLERHQDLRARFLGMPPDSEFFIHNLGHQARKLADFEKILLRPEVRTALGKACALAMSGESLLTLGHLLVALLEVDQSCTRLTLLKNGIDPDKLKDGLTKFFLTDQPRVHLGLSGIQVSRSLQSCLGVALKVMGMIGEQVLSARVLFLAILLQRDSGTIGFLATARIPLNLIWSTLIKEFFSKREAVAIRNATSDRLDVSSTLPKEGVFETMEFRLPDHFRLNYGK